MDIQRIIEYISKTGLTLSETQAGQLNDYYGLLVEWNSFMNLTAITEEEDVLAKHFADSLLYVPEKDACTLLDVGSGAGFPGIPLKIAHPELSVTLLDSLGKRVKFLNEVINRLGLKDISAIHGRAEDLARDAAQREHYDIVCSRAVAHMRVLSEYCLPFVKTGGVFVAYKSAEESASGEAEEAANALKILGGKAEEPLRTALPEDGPERLLIPVRKIAPCAKKYPRRAGTPLKEPL